MWRSRLAVGPAGWLTDALGLKATSPTPSLQLLIIPGNPGLGSFYTCFIQELHALFQGTADVWAVSNLGVWQLDTQLAPPMFAWWPTKLQPPLCRPRRTQPV